MRAVIQDRYGAPEDALHVVDDVERPTANEDEVLVKVHASTVTRGEAMGVRFKEYRFTRVFVGIRRPRRPICGMEFAGRVKEVGPAVSGFKVGDKVFGIDNATCAEYGAVGENRAIQRKPAGLSFEEAAAIPDGALLALTCLKPAYPLEVRYNKVSSWATCRVAINEEGMEGLVAHSAELLQSGGQVGVHSLRHSAAARMIAAGWTPKAIQQVMGHRSVSFTLDTYGHPFETDLDDFAARLDDPKIGGARVEIVSLADSERDVQES